MALAITNNEGVFEITGNLINKNALSLEHHFRQLMNHSEKIVISIDKVKQIDTYGIRVLTNLHKNAMKSNKIFYIIGKENKKVKNAFGKVNYILKKDFI
ncbi:STAS domain-containing protein [Aquimarina sp. 2201CG5-10]|uniref:STAS domain-containing protein n=1 Tax=Aquimarina callyspongiae TaxID=3098150 RepID=UPI002AB33B80|nr:STAS domain-containing protein [Aquimarina sp. 2201CG5-10]MDY8134644.1 STAS domain-containing protein [Aquimarina sp. 2201CG5-10]